MTSCPSLVDLYLERRAAAQSDATPRRGDKALGRAPTLPQGKRPVQVTTRIVGPRRKVVASQQAHTDHVVPTYAPEPSPRRSGPNSLDIQPHRTTRVDAREAKRDAELLEVFRFRRQKYDEALGHAHTILEKLATATEFLPREERLKTKSECRTQLASYSIKPAGRDVRVLTDATMEDPFLLDDVDADEQRELSELMKRREDAKASRAQQHQAALLLVGDVGATDRASSEEDVAEPENVVGASHPSEVARKRRIMRKLWMGNVIQLRDLYASKAGGFYNMLHGEGDGLSGGGASSGPPLPSLEFDRDQIDGDGDRLLLDEPAEADGLEATSTVDGAGDPSPGVASPEDGPAYAVKKKGGLDDRSIPPVPVFSSRSLAWIAESVCRDMHNITLSTENMLRVAMNQTLRRVGAIESELQTCRYLTKKSLAWCEAGESHARMYEAGEATMSEGVTMEIATQRKQVIHLHEELASLQKAVDDGKLMLDEFRFEVAEQKKRNALLMLALDKESVVELFPTRGDALNDDALALLRDRLAVCMSELDPKTGRRRFPIPSYATPLTGSECDELHHAVSRIVEALLRAQTQQRPAAGGVVNRSLVDATSTVQRARSILQRKQSNRQNSLTSLAAGAAPAEVTLMTAQELIES